MTGLTAQDLEELERGAAGLRAEGWASVVTYERLSSNWRRLAAEVADYPATVDDYTNDLTSREGLERLLDCCSPSVAARLQEVLRAVDDRFREGTDLDQAGTLGLFFRIDENSGWWLHRIPKRGLLRAYLEDAADRRTRE